MRTPKTIITLAAAAVLGAGGGAAVVAAAGGAGSTTTTTVQASAPSGQAVPAASNAKALSAGQVYDLAKDSVAYVTANVTQSSNSPFGGGGGSGQATGSGFVVSTNGLVVTNYHVIDGASSVQVKIGDGATQNAQVVGSDPSSDVALLKIGGGSSLKPLVLGDSNAVQVGDPVYAIGNPFGLDRTLTSGIVSALQRQITAPNGFSINGVIQTDAAINPGNSGGPLLNGSGQVIGITSQIESTNGGGTSGEAGSVGIGFAVPSDTVSNVVQQLEKGGTVKHAFLGVETQDAQNGSGAQVAGVTSGGPAASAGIQVGDTITSFDGKSVADAASLSGLVNAKQAGDKVTVKVTRGGSEKSFQVTLGSQPQQAGASSQQGNGNGGGNGTGNGFGPGSGNGNGNGFGPGGGNGGGLTLPGLP